MSPPAPFAVKDRLDPARAMALAATLGRPLPQGTLPPFWHHAYFWDAQPPERLGRDGHPKVGIGAIPDLGLPRRMWAGGALDWSVPMRLGEVSEKTTVCLSAERKTGRSGPLGLVQLEHVVSQDGRVAVRERQDLVYREAADPTATPPTPPDAGTAPVEEARHYDPVTLFRFSALTFNGHRIHYDVEYARRVEGHAGLVVHGPLLAEGLIDLATRHLGPLSRFSYRATAPLFAGEMAVFCLDGTRAFVRGPDGRLCMTSEAEAA